MINIIFSLTQTKEDIIAEFEERFQQEEYSNYSLVRNKEWPYGYDATWAIALMLNASQDVVDGETENGTRLEHFDYQNKEMARLFFDLLNDTDFEGLTVSQGMIAIVHISRITKISHLGGYTGGRFLSGSFVIGGWWIDHTLPNNKRTAGKSTPVEGIPRIVEQRGISHITFELSRLRKSPKFTSPPPLCHYLARARLRRS